MTKKQLTFNRGMLLGYTATHYNNNSRLKESYHSNIERSYGVGRHLSRGELLELDKQFAAAFSVDNVYRHLPACMQELGKDFLKTVQALHDDEWLWTAEGLTEEGRQRVESICDQFNIPFKNQ